MLKPELPILILEDRPTDADLAERELRRAGLKFRTERVENRETFERALVEFSPGLILADYSLPSFDGLSALAIARQKCPDVPFILISGTLGEDRAVEAVKNGATDFVLKQRLQRLVPVVQRALREAAERAERERVQEALREAEAKYRALFENAVEGIYQTTTDGKFLAANPAMVRILGYASAEELIRERQDIARQGYANPARRDEFQRLIEAHGTVQDFEYEARRKDRTTVWVSENARAIRDESGHVLCYEGTLQDITQRKRTEAALRESEQRLSTVFRASPAAICVNTIDEGRVIEVNERFAQFLGYSRTELVGRTVDDLKLWVHPAVRQRVMTRLKAEGSLRDIEAQFRQRNGEVRDGLISSEQVELAGESAPVTISMFVDVTERKRAEAGLRESEHLHHSLVESLPLCLFRKDRDGRFLFANQRFCALLGLPLDAIVGKMDADFFPPELAAKYRRDDLRVMESGEVFDDVEAYRIRGVERIQYVQVIKTPLRDTEGQITGVQGMFIDVTDRKEAELAVQQREAHFRSLIENSSDVITVVGPDGSMCYVSPSVERVLGYTPEELMGRNALELIDREDREMVQKALERAITKPQTPTLVTFRFRHKDGAWRLLEAVGQGRRSAPCEAAVVVNSRDVTHQDLLEAELRQAQKMEGIGQLAGGVAHDFNNILTIIQGYGSLLLMKPQSPEEAVEAAQQIVQASERAASLTRQLLLFSRKQVMQPRELDLSEAVTGIAKMLQRIIGEDVRLQLNLHPRPLLTRADPGMLDQVLMNLVVNARDAMPDGGQLIIETLEQTVTEDEARAIPDAAPGRHVCLRVSDTGSGISPENLSRIFEPFFTTKEAGKGTGLGLATVFGIVKQHGGWLTVESEVGRGTAFQIFLTAAAATAKSRAEELAKPKPRGGTETILLVEDEPSVRLLNRVVLEREGYRILEAATGPEALRVWEQHQGAIRLLLTDMVMPEGMTGRELAMRLQERSPNLRVIFSSGYSADIAGRELTLREGQNFLQKPCPPHQLLETVRQCLDG